MRLAFILLLFMTAADSMAKTITFEHPVERENNAALPANEIASFSFHYGAVSGEYSQSFTVSKDVTSFSFSPEVDTYCAMTTTDTEGRVSKFSNEVLITGVVAPMPPVIISIPEGATQAIINFK